MSGRSKKHLDELERTLQLRLRLKPVEIRRFMRAAAEFLIQAFEDVHVQHLALEIGAQQRFAEDGFVELLQFVHSKGLGKQIGTRHFDVEQEPQGLQCFTGDLAVVEDHFGEVVHGPPDTFRIEMARRGPGCGVVDQRIVAHADKTLHDPAIGGDIDAEAGENVLARFAAGPTMIAECAALFEVDGFEPCPLAKDPLCGAIEILFSADIAAGERIQGLVFHSKHQDFQESFVKTENGRIY